MIGIRLQIYKIVPKANLHKNYKFIQGYFFFFFSTAHMKKERLVKIIKGEPIHNESFTVKVQDEVDGECEGGRF